MRRSYHDRARVLVRVRRPAFLTLLAVLGLAFAFSFSFSFSIGPHERLALAQEHAPDRDAAPAASSSSAPAAAPPASVTAVPMASVSAALPVPPPVTPPPRPPATVTPPTATAVPVSALPLAASSSSSATASATASPSASASAAAAARATGEVRAREKSILVLRVPRGGVSAQERARVATAALEALLAQPDDAGEPRYEITQETAVVYVGKTPVLTLGQEDVEGSGEANLDVLGTQVTTRLAQAIANEKKRSAIATTVFSFSLLVFSGLLAFLLLTRVSEFAARLRTSMGESPEKVTALRIGRVELVSAGAARGTLSVTLALGHRFIQIAVAYGWLIFALSLFEATKGYTERLTGTVVKPLYGLASRIASALPIVVVATIAIVAVMVLVRFVGLFFDSITRGDTRAAWISRDLARPTSALARIGIVLVALVLGSPLITGESDGVVSRVGLVALLALALATVPLLASGIVGTFVVFGRRFKRGDDVEVGGRRGRVLDVTLLEVRLEDDHLAEVTVPHVLGLVHPTRIHRHARLATLEVVVDPASPQHTVEKALFEAARAQSSRGRVELVYLDDAGAHWRVTSAAIRHERTLAQVVQEALAGVGAGLGRGRASAPPSRPSANGERPTEPGET